MKLSLENIMARIKDLSELRDYERILNPSKIKYNKLRIQRMEEFYDQYSNQVNRAEVLQIPWNQVRTTDKVYSYTIWGDESDKEIIFIAHHDTFNGPGADDNGSGVAILEERLKLDLKHKPKYTHTYVFPGSEECGRSGLLAQLGVVFSINLYSAGFLLNWIPGLIGMSILSPLFFTRFGVTGSKAYIKNMGDKKIKAVIAVDSVGNGEFIIPENSIGVNFVRAFFPYKGCNWLNKLIRESAQELGIEYSEYLLGGTTDQVSFLQKGLPAAAILSYHKNKASPFIIGQKAVIHNKNDTAEKINPQNIRNTMNLLDLVTKRLEGNYQPKEIKPLNEFEMAALFTSGEKHYLGLKTLSENGKNINSIYEIDIEIDQTGTRIVNPRFISWGIDARLENSVRDIDPNVQKINLDKLRIEGADFYKQKGIFTKLRSCYHSLEGRVGHFVGKNSFAALFGSSIILASALTKSITGYYILTTNGFLANAINKLFETNLGNNIEQYLNQTLDSSLVLTTGLLFLFVPFFLKIIDTVIPTISTRGYLGTTKGDNLKCLIKK